MANYLTSSSLISQVKLEGMIPASQNTFTDNDFLSIANQEIRIGMLPTIMQYHEEFYVRDSEDITLEANKSSYAIPYRAIGGKFRELFYKDTSGNLRQMSRISPDDRPLYQQSASQNDVIYFFIQGNEIVLMPEVGANPTGSLVFSYYLRPNELVSEDRVGTIVGIAEGASTTVFTLNQIPQSLTAFVQDGVTLTGFSTSSKLDILQRKSGHKTISFDIYPTAVDVTNKTVTFNNDDLGDNIVTGDVIAFAEECIIPQIPTDLHEMLAQRVLQRCLQALGDQAGFSMSTAKLAEMEKNTGNLIDNRSEGSPQKATNMKGTLKAAKFRNRNWF